MVARGVPSETRLVGSRSNRCVLLNQQHGALAQNGYLITEGHQALRGVVRPNAVRAENQQVGVLGTGISTMHTARRPNMTS
jgi:hypothetical protein